MGRMARGQYGGGARGKSLGLRGFGVKGLGALSCGLAALAASLPAAAQVPTISTPSVGSNASYGGGFAGGLGGAGGSSSFGGAAPGGFSIAPGAYGAPAPAPATAAPASDVSAALDQPSVPPAWLLTPSIEVGETFTDNVNLAPRGSRVWDFITTVSPGLALAGQTAKLQVGLIYDPQEVLYARSTPSNALQQRLLGTGTAEVLHDLLFFDTSASISQAFVRPTGAVGPTTLTTNNNLQTVYAFNASPYLRQHWSSYANAETRYRYTTTSTSGSGIAAQDTNELRQTVLGGEVFGRLGWQAVADYTKLSRAQDSTDAFSGVSSKDTLLRVDLKYPLIQGLSAIGGVGYERISDPTLSNQPRGVIWNTGFQYQPNQLVSVALTYGERFGGTDIELNAAYNLDPQLSLNAIYTQTIQTSLSQIAGNLNQTTIDPTTGLPVSPGSPGAPPVAGAPPVTSASSPSSSAFGISSGSYIAKTAEIDAVLTKERNTYSLRTFLSKQSGNNTTSLSNSSLAVSSSTVTAERIFGGALGWAHKLQPNLSSNANASYTRAIFLDGTGRHDNIYIVSIGLDYTFSRLATATISLSRSDQRSNIPVNSVASDIIMATIRKQF